MTNLLFDVIDEEIERLQKAIEYHKEQHFKDEYSRRIDYLNSCKDIIIKSINLKQFEYR